MGASMVEKSPCIYMCVGYVYMNMLQRLHILYGRVDCVSKRRKDFRKLRTNLCGYNIRRVVYAFLYTRTYCYTCVWVKMCL